MKANFRGRWRTVPIVHSVVPVLGRQTTLRIKARLLHAEAN
jgi:hypothetical protein